MVHYIQPYSTAKNIGGAINLAIENLVTSDDDWVVLMDHDILFLLPDTKRQIEKILSHTDYVILGARTNRIGADQQKVSCMFDKTNIIDHIYAAKNLHNNFYGKVSQARAALAGFLLCFKVSTWKELGRFEENNIKFDTLFCNRAIRAQLKLGIMWGVYVFHLYRLWAEGNPRQNYQHLLP